MEKENKLDEEFIILKEKFEAAIERTIKTEDDCKVVGEYINDKFPDKDKNNDGFIISLKTLKRVFGILPYENSHSNTTLHTLARCVGFKDWDDFKSKINNTYNPSVPSIEEVFESQREEIRKLQKEIPNKNATYILGWYPEKYSKLKYLGGFGFEVIESKNMKKKATETFISPDFSLSPVENSKFPDIMLDDYDDDYFDTQRKEEGEQFDEDYFYL